MCVSTFLLHVIFLVFSHNRVFESRIYRLSYKKGKYNEIGIRGRRGKPHRLGKNGDKMHD